MVYAGELSFNKVYTRTQMLKQLSTTTCRMFVNYFGSSLAKAVTLTDFTLHFSCCFTNLLHSHFVPLLNNFTMQEKCY